MFPGCGAARSGAPLIRDRSRLGDCYDPGSAAHHFVLRCRPGKRIPDGKAYAATVPKNSSNSLRSLAVANSTSSVAASMVSAELRVWVTPLATSSSAAEIALAPAAALATLCEISPVAAYCCSTEPATDR